MACEWIIPRQLFTIGCPMNAHDRGISNSYFKLPVVPNFDSNVLVLETICALPS